MATVNVKGWGGGGGGGAGRDTYNGSSFTAATAGGDTSALGCTAHGGQGGQHGGESSPPQGGSGGTATGGDTNTTGGNGSNGGGSGVGFGGGAAGGNSPNGGTGGGTETAGNVPGGGGGGGNGYVAGGSSADCGGAGGGAGGYFEKLAAPIVSGTPYTVTIGAAGAHGTATNNGHNGADGAHGRLVIRALLSQNISATGGTHTTDATYDYWTFDASGTWTPTFTAPPSVSTSAATGVNLSGATLNGDITDTGGLTPDTRGFVYGTTSQGDPGNVAPASSGYDAYTTESGSFSTGVFDAAVTGLSTGVTIYARAYAHNSDGYAYGAEISFVCHIPAGFEWQNLSGLSYVAGDTQTIFAEQLNDILRRLEALE